MNDKLIDKLFKLAKKSYLNDEFPVSAIIFNEDGVVSTGYNRRNKSNMTTDHAEIIAINKANKKLKSWRIPNTCMIVTLEPCDMCKAVIKEARISKVYYIVPRYNYKKQYKCTNIEKMEIESKLVDDYLLDIKNFFKNKR